jgi:hypothetical protein
VRQKDSYLRAQFYHIRARRGPKKAMIAVAASILTSVYHMLRERRIRTSAPITSNAATRISRNIFSSNVWQILATRWR